MMPTEKIPTATFGPTDAVLIEARSIGGLSGSPAFVRADAPFARGPMFLLGLMHGHWDLPVDAINDQGAEDSPRSNGVNLGIAIVVPAQKIREVLEGEELTELRARAIEDWKRSREPELGLELDGRWNRDGGDVSRLAL